MKLTDQQAKNHVLNRLRRIEGQIRGVQEMIMQERDGKEIIQQLSAIHSAIQGAGLSFVEQNASKYLLSSEADNLFRREKILEEFLILFNKAA